MMSLHIEEVHNMREGEISSFKRGSRKERLYTA